MEGEAAALGLETKHITNNPQPTQALSEGASQEEKKGSIPSINQRQPLNHKEIPFHFIPIHFFFDFTLLVDWIPFPRSLRQRELRKE